MPSRAEGTAFERILAVSERVDWRIEEVLPNDTRFDFGRAFLPESLVHVASFDFLTPAERLTLGHVRAHGYLGLFGVVEEMILPFVLDHARGSELRELEPVRALLRFASEEAKHIELFRRFSVAFRRGFQGPCALVGPADEFARAVLAHPPLSVALAILHIEWMTQRHWLTSLRGDAALEPAFTRLLRYHWLEEAQHARLDDLIARELARRLDPAARAAAIEGYAAIVGLLDGALAAQVALDLRSFQEATGRTLDHGEARRFRDVQHASLRRVFLHAGMTHPRFLATVSALSSDGPTRVAELALALSPTPAPPGDHDHDHDHQH